MVRRKVNAGAGERTLKLTRSAARTSRVYLACADIMLFHCHVLETGHRTGAIVDNGTSVKSGHYGKQRSNPLHVKNQGSVSKGEFRLSNTAAKFLQKNPAEKPTALFFYAVAMVAMGSTLY